MEERVHGFLDRFYGSDENILLIKFYNIISHITVLKVEFSF